MLAFEFPFDFHEPTWLWLCLLVPALVLASRRSLAGLSPARRTFALVTRSLIIILLACCLAGIERVQRNEDLTVIFLMDRSHSVEQLQSFQEQFVRESAKNIPPDDRVGLIDFARNAYLQQLPMRGGYFIPPGRLPQMPDDDRTNVAGALRLAMAMFPHDTAKRIVLMSDGNDNMGDVLTEAQRAGADGIPIDIVPLRYKHTNEIYFERMIAPTHAEPGEQASLRMVVHSDETASGTLDLYINSQLYEMPEGQNRVTLKPGSNTLFVKVPIQSTITQSYEAIFKPDKASKDTLSLNNTARSFTFVSGKSRVLLVTDHPEQDDVLAKALRSENVLVDMKRTSELGEFDLPQMMTYSTIILSNVPAASFTEKQQEAMAVFVKDMGSGLIMTGGDEGFGAGGWIGSPIEEVMPVTFEIKHKRIIPRGALVLIMHSCEIARGNYWAKEMAKKSVDTISSRDYFGILAYSYSPGGENWEVPLDVNANKAAVKAKIDRLQNGDMPDFDACMRMAFRELISGKGKDAAQKHVIIMSDGDAAPPSNALLRDYAAAKITVSTIGLGWGMHVMEPTMRDIARRTGGTYYAARNPRQLPQIFSKESKVVRRPLIIEETFTPQVLFSQNDLLPGISAQSSIPPLGGLVLTSPKQSPNVIIPLVRSTTDGNDPVLIYWHYELGKAVAFTSGYWPNWGQSWTSWPQFAKVWAQITRWTMRQESLANFDTHTKIEGNRAHIVIDAMGKDAGYLNHLIQKARIVGPNNEVLPVQFTQTGPGKYEADFEVEKAGQYIATVQVFDRGRNLGTLQTGVSIPFSPEYRDLIPNESLLRQVADISKGRWHEDGPSVARVFSHDMPPTESKRPAWEWMLGWLLLPLFLLDVSVRRLASWLALSFVVEIVVLVVLLWGVDMGVGSAWRVLEAILIAESIGWAVRFRYIGPMFNYFTHGVTAMAHTGERSAASLDKLKNTRDRIREDQAESSVERLARVSQQTNAVSGSDTAKHYEADQGSENLPIGDLTKSMGGLSAEAKTEKKTSKADDQPSGKDESATSRLLRARQRAKKKMGDE